MSEHKMLTHDDCKVKNCIICVEQIKYCTSCLGVGHSLPTECPGKPMSDTIQALVASKNKDFNNGKWRSVYG